MVQASNTKRHGLELYAIYTGLTYFFRCKLHGARRYVRVDVGDTVSGERERVWYRSEVVTRWPLIQISKIVV